MKIQIGKRFAKDVQGITDQRILRKIRGVVEHARSAESLGEIQELEAMSGYFGFYRKNAIIAIGEAFISTAIVCSFCAWVAGKTFTKNFRKLFS